MRAVDPYPPMRRPRTVAPAGAPVSEQLRILRAAVDSLTTILMEELDSLSKDLVSARKEARGQLSTLRRSVVALEGLPEEFAALRREVDTTKGATSKLDHRAEHGVRRLNEALAVQQQALAGIAEDIGRMKHSISRSDDELRRAEEQSRRTSEVFDLEMERLRSQVTKSATSGHAVEEAVAHLESKWDAKSASVAHVERAMLDFRATVEGRLAALERGQRTAAHSPDTETSRPPPVLAQVRASRRESHAANARGCRLTRGCRRRAAQANVRREVPRTRSGPGGVAAACQRPGGACAGP